MELGDNPRLVERRSHHVAPLLPANGGKDAWVLLAACLTVEALVYLLNDSSCYLTIAPLFALKSHIIETAK